MGHLTVLALLLLVALGTGRRTLRAVPFTWPLEASIFGVAFGLGLLGYATLALGLAGLLYRPALLVLLAAGAWYGRREMGAAVRAGMRGAGRWWAAGEGGRGERAAVALGALLLGAELVVVLAPPIGGDQTKYQLVYPRLYAEAHRIVDTPWSFWGYVQYLVNMLFTAAFVLRGDVLARLINAAFGVLATLAIFAAGRRLFTRRTGVWAAILFFTMPFSATLMTRAWVEFALALYAVLAVLATLSWRASGARSWLVLAAVMAGLAAGTKPIGVLVPGLLGLVVAADAVRRRAGAGLRTAVAATLAFGLIAGVVASPCYLRNAVATGNPTFPFGYGVFGGRYWSAEAARGLADYYAAYREAQAARRGGGHTYRAWWEALRFPWDATMAPYAFEEVARSAYDVGPVILAFAPGVVLLDAPAAWILAGLATAYGAVVVLGMWAHPRYVHPTLPLLLLVAAAVIERCHAYGRPVRRGLTALLVVTVAAQGALALKLILPRWSDSARVALGRMSEEAFLRRYEPRYALAALVHDAVPRDGNVLVLGLIPHPYYYLGRRFTLASPLEQGAIDYRRIATVDDLVGVLRGLGVTHVVRETDPEKPWANPVGAHLFALWDGLVARCEKIAEAEAGALYRLPAAGVTMPAEHAA